MNAQDEAKQRAQRIMDFNRQAAEIASKYNNDAAIDHSQPHDPTDMERALQQLDRQANPNSFGQTCKHGVAKEEPCEQCTEENEAYEDMLELDELTHGEIREYIPNNEGYRACSCEDYPCCGH